MSKTYEQAKAQARLIVDSWNRSTNSASIEEMIADAIFAEQDQIASLTAQLERAQKENASLHETIRINCQRIYKAWRWVEHDTFDGTTELDARTLLGEAVVDMSIDAALASIPAQPSDEGART